MADPIDFNNSIQSSQNISSDFEDIVQDPSHSWIFINPDTYANEQVNQMLDYLINSRSASLNLDKSLSTLAYGEKESTKSFFKTVLDQPPHITKDHIRIRRFIIDWYSAHKTLVTKSRKSTDLQLLRSDEINELIKGFGFPYPRFITGKSNKISFLLNLINLYKRKGTSYSLYYVLKLYGLTDIIISEWWLKYDKSRIDQLYLESNAVYPEKFRNLNRYILNKPFESFNFDPYWQQSKEELLSNYNDSSNLITLPSITPYISIQSYSRLSDLNLAIAIMQRKFHETFSFWLGYTLIPIKVFEKYSDWIQWKNRTSEPAFLNVIGPLKILNKPPSNLPTTQSDLNSDLATLNNIENLIVVVGPNPLAGTPFEDHARQLATYTWNNETNLGEWTFNIVKPKTDNINHYGSAFIAHHDSDIAANKLIRWGIDTNQNQTLEIFSTTTNSCIYKVDYPFYSKNSESMIFNGTKWVGLNTIIPANELLNRNENIDRSVFLNGFESSYSVFEILLAIAYLHNGPYKSTPTEPFKNSSEIANTIYDNFDILDSDSNEYLSLEEINKRFSGFTESNFDEFDENNSESISVPELTDQVILDRHYYYNGAFSPLDGLSGIRDNIDDLASNGSKYDPIIREYNNVFYDLDAITSQTKMSFRHPSNVIVDTRYIYTPPDLNGDIDPRFKIQTRQKLFYNKFTTRNSIEPSREIIPQLYPEFFLEAVNPQFKKELDTKLLGEDKDVILEGILTDYEFHMKNIMEILTISFAYVQMGGAFLNKKLLPVIDFFKPFRVRLLDFITNFEINEPLMDSMIPGDKDQISCAINQLFVDKPFPLDRNQTIAYLNGLEYSAPVYLSDGITEIGTMIVRSSLDESFIFEFDLISEYRFILFTKNIKSINVSDASNFIKYASISGKKFEYKISKAVFENNKTNISKYYVILFNGFSGNSSYAYVDVGQFLENFVSYPVIYDNGLPMDDINIVRVDSLLLDVMSSPTDPQYSTVSAASKWSDVSSAWIRNDLTEVNRLEFDITMNDTFFVQIKSPNPSTPGEYIYVDSINVDDSEIVSDFTEIYLNNEPGGLYTSDLFTNSSAFATCNIEYDSTSSEFNFTFQSNFDDLSGSYYNESFKLIAIDGSGTVNLFSEISSYSNPFTYTISESSLVNFMTTNSEKEIYIVIQEGITAFTIKGSANNAIESLLQRYNIEF